LFVEKEEDEMGLCKWTAPKGWHCQNIQMDGSRLCEHHREYHNTYMREWREKFKKNKLEAKQRARRCRCCQQKKESGAFYQTLMADQEQYWNICRLCMGEKIKAARWPLFKGCDGRS